MPWEKVIHGEVENAERKMRPEALLPDCRQDTPARVRPHAAAIRNEEQLRFQRIPNDDRHLRSLQF